MKLKNAVSREKYQIYTRPRLFATFRQALSNPLVIAAAPAGFGKTTAVYDFFSSSQGKYHLAWMRLTPTDNHPLKFLRTLERALFRAGADTSAFRQAEDFGLEDILHAFSLAAESMAGRLPLVLVIDDFHLITIDALVQYIEELVRMRLGRVRVMVLSRTMPNFSLTDLAIKNLVSIVTQDDFRFTDEEARGWLAMRDITLSGETFSDLMRETDGWISGMYLNTVSLVPSGAAERAARFFHTGSDDMLDKEIFSKYDTDVRDFLLSIAPLDEYPLSLCRFVSGRDDADELFERAMQSNLFIKKAGDSYYIHNIFGTFLKKKQRALSPEAYNKALETAGDWYLQSGDAQTAMSFYTLTGAHEKMIGAILGTVSKFGGVGPLLNEFKRGEFSIMYEQLSTIPIDYMRQASPLLEIFCLVLMMMLHKHDEYSAKAAEMFEYYESKDRSEQEDRALGELIIIDSFLTNASIKERGVRFERAAALIGGRSVFGTSDAPVTLGFPSMLFLFSREPLPLDELIGSYSHHWARFRELLGGVMDGIGEIVRGELFFERGDFESAKPLIDEGRRKASNKDVEIAANAALMRCAVAQGDYDACMSHIGEIVRIARERDKALFYIMADYCRGYIGSVVPDPSIVPQWLAQCDSAVERPLLSEMNGLEPDVLPKALVLACAGQWDGLEGLITRMSAIYEAGNVRFGMLYCRIYEATIAFARHDVAGAVAALDEARKTAEPEGLVMPFAERSLALFPLVQYLERNTHEMPNAAFESWLEGIARVMKAWNRSVLGLKKRHNSREKKTESPLSGREAEVGRMISEGMSRSEIRDMLGITDNNLKVIMSRIRSKNVSMHV